MAFKTRRARLGRAIRLVYEWCRSHRHLPVQEQHVALKRRLDGHMNYFGVSGNTRSLHRLIFHAKRAWFKGRRSQHGRISWERFIAIERRFPLPRPSIRIALWAI